MADVVQIADLAIGFWVRDYDMRGVAPKVELDEATVLFTPTAGLRLWIYCAQMAWDPRDGPQLGRSPTAWCASRVYPEGEYGLIDNTDPSYRPITRQTFLDAANNGWPDYEGGTP